MANNNFIVKNGLTAPSIIVSGNATINAIVANGSTGLANQVLSSNGTGLYWANVAAGATFVRQLFTANSTVNTTFTITNGYTVNSIDVYKNGVKLIVGTEVTANDGTSITLATPAISNTIIDVVGLLSASVYSLNINTVSQGFAFSWTNNHIFSSNLTVNAAVLTVGTSTANAVINGSSLTIGNTTANAVVNTTSFVIGNTTANAVINGSSLTIGNTTANAVINGSSLTIGNTTANAVVNTTSFVIGNTTANAVVNTTSFVIGNTTANAVVNTTSFVIANSSVTYSYIAPTSVQKANTSFFLNANGSWASISAPAVSSLEAFRTGII